MEENVINKFKCTGCGACYSICPKNAIEMKADEEGFLYPYIDNTKCVHCELCKNICPVINEKIKKNNQPETIAAYTKNEKERKNSSSGGIFYEMAKYIINQGGVVIGASYNENMEVIHKSICRENEINLLQGSKYVQSNTLDTFKQTKELLENKQKVLYVGTPCQIAGVNAYLKKNYDSLYTCDLVCHGAPSPKVWKKYIEEKQKNKKIINYFFRNKTKGWNNYGVKICYYDGKKIFIDSYKDEFFKLFIKNYSLRNSCYSCNFSKIPREADISLGDFWGVEGKYNEFKDNKGTSLVLINNKKGKELFENISVNLNYKEKCDLNYAIKCNPCINSSVAKPGKREEFFNDLENKNFKQLIKKYIPKERRIARRIIGKIYKIVKK